MNISAEITGLGYLHPELFLAPHVTAESPNSAVV